MANKDDFGQKGNVGQGGTTGSNPSQRPEDLDKDRKPYDRDLDDKSKGTGGMGGGQGSSNPSGSNR